MSHGLVWSKSTLCLRLEDHLTNGRSDGQRVDFPVLRGHIIVLLEQKMLLEDVSVMLIIKLVFMQDSLYQDPMQRLSLDNGNTKLVLV